MSATTIIIGIIAITGETETGGYQYDQIRPLIRLVLTFFCESPMEQLQQWHQDCYCR